MTGLDQGIPPVIRTAADELFVCAVSWIERMASQTALPSADPVSSCGTDVAAEALLSSYCALCAVPSSAAHQRFHLAAGQYNRALRGRLEQARAEGVTVLGMDVDAAWRGKWAVYDCLWCNWSVAALRPVPLEPTIIHLNPAGPSSAPSQYVGSLTADQQTSMHRLLGLLRARATLTEAGLSGQTMACWSAPLLLGSAGSGKMRVCEEVARRWSNRPCRRWELATWMLRGGYGTSQTAEDLNAYIKANPDGCVVYLSGVERLVLGRTHCVHYTHAVIAEVCHFLDRALERGSNSVRRRSTASAAPLVVLGGDYPALRRHRQVADDDAMNDWKDTADELPSEPSALAAWLREKSGLPVELLSRVGGSPLLLQPPSEKEAARLAAEFHQHLPPSYDGIEVDELSAELRGPRGWHAVMEKVEWAFADDGVDTPLSAGAPPVNYQRIKAELYSSKIPKKAKLSLAAYRSRRPAHGSELFERAKQLGLDSLPEMDAVARVRGYTVPGEKMNTLSRRMVSAEEYSDSDVMFSLLSFDFEDHARALCRGAVMLHVLLTSMTAKMIAASAREMQAESVVRHIAMLGLCLSPEDLQWRKLLTQIQVISPSSPGFCFGAMPDDEIIDALRMSIA